MLRSLRARSKANESRLCNEIDLVSPTAGLIFHGIVDRDQAFNTIAQHDSTIAVKISEAARRDSAAMKTIAVLTMIFLPATFVSVGRLKSSYTSSRAAYKDTDNLQYELFRLFP